MKERGFAEARGLGDTVDAVGAGMEKIADRFDSPLLHKPERADTCNAAEYLAKLNFT